jgi:D-alanyl-D-alanine carboxypeptidase
MVGCEAEHRVESALCSDGGAPSVPGQSVRGGRLLRVRAYCLQMDISSLRAAIDQRAVDHDFSGVAMVWRERSPVFAHAAGLAHRGFGIPVSIDTRFHVASITKMVTAVAALRLVERGLIDLRQPLTEVLPPELRPRSLTPEHTLHHLLSHTSGLTNYHDIDDETFDSFKACWEAIPPQKARRSADLLPLFVDLPLMFAPGERFEYGDVNYIMIGILMESATGTPYPDIVGTEVLEPARMGSSGFVDLDLEPQNLATGFMVTDGPPDSWRTNRYAIPVGGLPDGGLVTTAADLCRFIDALNDGELIGDATRDSMLTSYGKINEDAEDYGYGFEMFMSDGRAAILGHAGGDPGVSAIVSHFVGDATTIVVVCNFDRGSWPVSKMLAEAYGITDPRE